VPRVERNLKLGEESLKWEVRTNLNIAAYLGVKPTAEMTLLFEKDTTKYQLQDLEPEVARFNSLAMDIAEAVSAKKT
jgi:hypothetical protein